MFCYRKGRLPFLVKLTNKIGSNSTADSTHQPFPLKFNQLLAQMAKTSASEEAADFLLTLARHFAEKTIFRQSSLHHLQSVKQSSSFLPPIPPVFPASSAALAPLYCANCASGKNEGLHRPLKGQWGSGRAGQMEAGLGEEGGGTDDCGLPPSYKYKFGSVAFSCCCCCCWLLPVSQPRAQRPVAFPANFCHSPGRRRRREFAFLIPTTIYADAPQHNNFLHFTDSLMAESERANSIKTKTATPKSKSLTKRGLFGRSRVEPMKGEMPPREKGLARERRFKMPFP
jgi:hypothetical protein